MPQPREYNPVVREIRTDASLRPAVSPGSLQSFAGARAAEVERPRIVGTQYEQLVRALNKLDPALDRFSKEKQEEKRQELIAKGYNLSQEEGNLRKSFQQLVLENPEMAGASPYFKEGYQKAQLERLGLEYRSELLRTASENGWNNTEDPQELARKAQEFAAGFRQNNLSEFLQEDQDHPLVAAYFGKAQMEAESVLQNWHTGQRIEANYAKGEQEFQNLSFAGVNSVVESMPDFFRNPAALPQRQAVLAQYLVSVREQAKAAGIREDIANKWIQEGLFKYARTLGLNNPNDHRAEALFGVLDHIPSGSGPLGQTVQAKLALAEYRDWSINQQVRNDDLWWRNKERQEKEQAKQYATIAMRHLRTNPDMKKEELEQVVGYPVDDMLFAKAVVEAKQYSQAASSTMETQENRRLAAELVVQAHEGKLDMPDVRPYLSQLTEAQQNRVIAAFPADQREGAVMRRMMDDAGASEFLHTLKQAQAEDGAQVLVGNQLPAEKALGRLFRQQAAELLWKNAVYDELSRLKRDGIQPDRKQVRDLMESHMRILSDVNNPQVKEYAASMQESRFDFSSFDRAQQGHQTATVLQGKAPQFAPGKGSILAKVPGRALGFLDAAARQTGVDVLLMHSVAQWESGFNENAKNPASSASGLMQLTDATARDMGVNKHDPAENALGGAKRIQQILQVHPEIDPSTREGVAQVYRYYHDGPWVKEAPDAFLSKRMYEVADTYMALQTEQRGQQAAQQQQRRQQREADVAKLREYLPDANAIQAWRTFAPKENQPHPLTAALNKANKAKGKGEITHEQLAAALEPTLAYMERVYHANGLRTEATTLRRQAHQSLYEGGKPVSSDVIYNELNHRASLLERQADQILNDI